MNIDKYGNTTSGTIPLLLWDYEPQLKKGDNLVIAAAHNRPKLYGSFTLRAYQRYGSSADLIPLAEDFQEFSTDYKLTTQDQELANRIRAASSIFFVGGAPQRLSNVLSEESGQVTALATAILENYQSGGLIIGGIPGATALATDTDLLEVLTQGEISSHHLVSGLGLIDNNWFVDQHVFGNGRLATSLVAMHQLGLHYGIGVGLDTAAVVHNGIVEVLGNRGVALIDVSNASFSKKKSGMEIKGVRLSYLENGDRVQMDTLALIPYNKKANDFELLPKTNASENFSVDTFISSQNVLVPGEFVRLMYDALDAESGQSTGFAPLEGSSRKGFLFRFYTGADSRGWLSTATGEDRFTLQNIYLDISPTT